MTIDEIFRDVERVPDFFGLTITSVNYRNAYGDSPLHIVANQGECEAISVLVAAGADINAIGESGYTPLHCAIEQEHPEAIRLLLSLGAAGRINARGESEIDMANCTENDEVIYALSENT